jgi:hypothetical protein
VGKKTAWVLGCFLSAVVLPVIWAIGLAIAIKFFGYEYSVKSMIFGQFAKIAPIGNISVFVLPWVVYFIFKRKYAKNHP